MPQHAIWGATVRKAVLLQWGIVIALGAGSWLLAGASVAKSVIAGGSAVALPNTVLALWLLLRMQMPGVTGAAAIMRGEILKLGFTTGLLVLVVSQLKAELSWIGMLVGVVGALKAHWLALWVTRRF